MPLSLRVASLPSICYLLLDGVPLSFGWRLELGSPGMKLNGGSWLNSRLSDGPVLEARTSLKSTMMVKIMSDLFMALWKWKCACWEVAVVTTCWGIPPKWRASLVLSLPRPIWVSKYLPREQGLERLGEGETEGEEETGGGQDTGWVVPPWLPPCLLLILWWWCMGLRVGYFWVWMETGLGINPRVAGGKRWRLEEITIRFQEGAETSEHRWQRWDWE